MKRVLDKKWHLGVLACVGLTALWVGVVYAANLAVDAPSSVDGLIAVPVVLSAEAGNAASLQFDMTYDPERYVLYDVYASDAADQAGKDVAYSTPDSGSVRVLVAGFNQETIPEGAVALVYLAPIEGASDEYSAFSLGEVTISDPFGDPIAQDFPLSVSDLKDAEVEVSTASDEAAQDTADASANQAAPLRGSTDRREGSTDPATGIWVGSPQDEQPLAPTSPRKVETVQVAGRVQASATPPVHAGNAAASTNIPVASSPRVAAPSYRVSNSVRSEPSTLKTNRSDGEPARAGTSDPARKTLASSVPVLRTLGPIAVAKALPASREVTGALVHTPAHSRDYTVIVCAIVLAFAAILAAVRIIVFRSM